MLERTTSAMTRNYAPDSDGKRGSRGIKTVISPVLDRLIKANKKVIGDVADGGTCAEYYPTQCDPPGSETYQACIKAGRVGLITCSKDVGAVSRPKFGLLFFFVMHSDARP